CAREEDYYGNFWFAYW
nr:immunoglobulin heavy chain junction region [Mus musculus]NSM06348.1 immunoglobulin heavy chain junction region [Mus musculus]NSM07995.1 immunoglobulin heavy chain junction region [Mus musculus]NSM08542.1 immunoglobulin heavy chain junction region [Mus musculus]NSM08915.1 immunoglobulin heavy chain junction region [Mus musculus]